MPSGWWRAASRIATCCAGSYVCGPRNSQVASISAQACLPAHRRENAGAQIMRSRRRTAAPRHPGPRLARRHGHRSNDQRQDQAQEHRQLRQSHLHSFDGRSTSSGDTDVAPTSRLRDASPPYLLRPTWVWISTARMMIPPERFLSRPRPRVGPIRCGRSSGTPRRGRCR